MEILLWLVPPAVVTCVAMAWVSWLGREGRGEISRDEAVARLGSALERGGQGRRGRRPHPGYAAPAPPPDRSSGVTVRRPPAERTRLTSRPGGRVDEQPGTTRTGRTGRTGGPGRDERRRDRRAS